MPAVSVAFRWDAKTKAAIKARADKLELSLSEYVKRAALDQLEEKPSTTKRLERLEQRLQRLEEQSKGPAVTTGP